MNELVKSFQQWLMEEGRAKTTIESYVGDIVGFQKYLLEKAADESLPLSRFSFVRYKNYLIDKNFAVSTINTKIVSLKVFNSFLLKQNLVEENYIQLKRDCVQIAAGSEHVVTALSEEEVERILFYLEDQTKVSQRRKLIGYLLLFTGARVTELVNIKVADIDMLTATLTVRGKGNKIREISLRQDVLALVNNYMKGERAQSKFVESEFLLMSQRSPKLHRDSIRSWLSIISKELGFKLHPHLFRHTFCTRLLNKGVDITTVSKLAGHSSVNMTMKYYINISREQKRDAVDKL
jgi:integrase/recombinase XerD